MPTMIPTVLVVWTISTLTGKPLSDPKPVHTYPSVEECVATLAIGNFGKPKDGGVEIWGCLPSKVSPQSGTL